VKLGERMRIGMLVHDVSRLRRTAFDQRARALGITRSRWWILLSLSHYEDNALAQIDLARLLGLGNVAVGGLVDGLEKSRLVKRRADPSDRRINRLLVTSEGRKVLRRMDTVGAQIEDEVMKGISEENRCVLYGILQTMKSNLAAIDPASNSKSSNAGRIRSDKRPQLQHTKARRASASPVSSARGCYIPTAMTET
jgi:MarR family transcriptional regulator, transcriptional regulator for hemolysin